MIIRGIWLNEVIDPKLDDISASFTTTDASQAPESTLIRVKRRPCYFPFIRSRMSTDQGKRVVFYTVFLLKGKLQNHFVAIRSTINYLRHSSEFFVQSVQKIWHGPNSNCRFRIRIQLLPVRLPWIYPCTQGPEKQCFQKTEIWCRLGESKSFCW